MPSVVVVLYNTSSLLIIRYSIVNAPTFLENKKRILPRTAHGKLVCIAPLEGSRLFSIFSNLVILDCTCYQFDGPISLLTVASCQEFIKLQNTIMQQTKGPGGKATLRNNQSWSFQWPMRWYKMEYNTHVGVWKRSWWLIRDGFHQNRVTRDNHAVMRTKRTV